MVCLFLLLTVASIININAVPIDQNKLPYRLSYLEKVVENYKKHNLDTAKSSYELGPRPQSNSANRNGIDNDGCNSVEDFSYNDNCRSRRHSNYDQTTQPYDGLYKAANDPDDVKRKRSLNSQKLYEKLIALGFDYVQVMNVLEAVHQYRQKV